MLCLQTLLWKPRWGHSSFPALPQRERGGVPVTRAQYGPMLLVMGDLLLPTEMWTRFLVSPETVLSHRLFGKFPSHLLNLFYFTEKSEIHLLVSTLPCSRGGEGLCFQGCLYLILKILRRNCMIRSWSKGWTSTESVALELLYF